MAQTIEIRKKIGSVQNTKKIEQSFKLKTNFLLMVN